MTSPREHNLADFRTDYASQSDFCKVLEQDLKPLYLLAFLLTANNEKAELCFATTAQQALEEHTVFKGFVRSWIKRCLIKNAIGMVFPTSAGSTEGREFGSTRQDIADDELDAVTQLPPVERCAFVMSVLERYSDWECSLLLGCSAKKVAKARMRALRRFSGPVALTPGSEPRVVRFVGIPA